MKKTIKKSLALLLAVLMLVGVSPMGWAIPMECPECGEQSEWVPTEQIPATCKEVGHEAGYICQKCGKYAAGGKEIPLVEHTYQLYAGETVYCTKDAAKKLYQCSVCNKLFLQTIGEDNKPHYEEATDLTGHNLPAEPVPAVAPKCAEAGNVAYYECPDCHKCFSDKDGKNELAKTTVDALGGTCEASDNWTYMSADGQPFDCTKTDNLRVKLCKKCGAVVTTDPNPVEPSSGHTFGTKWEFMGENGAPYDCEKKGYRVKRCTNEIGGVRCTAVDETEIYDVPADRHTNSNEWTYLKADGSEGFNCLEGGKKVKLCTKCPAVLEEETIAAATQHFKWGGVQAKPATCYEPGYSAHRKCERCGATDGLVVEPIKQHEFEKHEKVEANCQTVGYPEYYACKYCGLVSEDKDGIVILDPVGDDGKFVPGAYLESVKVVVGHTFADAPAFDALEPACGHAGRKAILKCTGCNQLFVAADRKEDGTYDEDCVEVDGVMYKIIANVNDPAAIIPKYEDHDWYYDTSAGSVGYVAPTCEAAGQCIRKCQRPGCGVEEVYVLEALPHTKKANDKGVYHGATCTEDSYSEFVCAVCGKTFKEPGVEEATGHDFQGQPEEVVIASTCTEHGWYGKYCKNGCGAYTKTTQTVPVAGHNWAPDSKPAKCTGAEGEDLNGYTREYCTVCGVTRNEVIIPGGHIDENQDGYCDRCTNYIKCDHICHKTDFFSKFVWFIMNVWNQFLSINATCKCGEPHYVKAGDINVPD